MSTLLRGLQVILQTELASKKVLCEGFRKLPIVHSVYIGIATDRSHQAFDNAGQLRREIICTLHQMGIELESPKPPCGGRRRLIGRCHAFGVPDCRKLLVLIGDGTSIIPIDSRLEHDIFQSDNVYILPVLPHGTDPRKTLPSHLRKINCCFWKKSIQEIVPAVLSTVGLVSNDYRIFISYIRKETASLAEQIFDALVHENFDVFLDRFRVPPAIDFQRRLTQELADKSMVLMLESPGILSSEWTIYEIVFAILHRLGIAAVNVPGGVHVPGIPSSRRFEIKPSNMKAKGTLLKSNKIHQLVDFIKHQHGLAISRKRAILRRNLTDAFLYAGIVHHKVSTNGLLTVESLPSQKRRSYAVWLTPRPPDVSDFHLTDTYAASGTKGIIVGPARFFESDRKATFEWLSQTSNIACFDEGNLLAAARDMAGGSI